MVIRKMEKQKIDKKDLQFNTEVYEILNKLGKEYIRKIPNQLYSYIENNRNKNSIFEIDINKPLEEQDVMQDVLLFVAYLNIQYWSTDEEKEQLIKKYGTLDENEEIRKREKYDIDNIFEQHNSDKNVEQKSIKQMEMIKYKKESLFDKIIKLIHKLLKKGKSVH